MRLLKLLFGPKMLEFVHFVFTRGDCFDSADCFDSEVIAPLVGNASDEVAIDAAASAESAESTFPSADVSYLHGASRTLRGWLLATGRRYVLIDNAKQPPGQVEYLLEQIDTNLRRVSESCTEHGTAPHLGYTRADFEAHAQTLTEAQQRALHEPLSPEQQEAAARALSGQVSGLKKEVTGLKTLIQSMTSDQSQTIMTIVQQMRLSIAQQQAPSKAPGVTAVLGP
jgi:hypothetical protein